MSGSKTLKKLHISDLTPYRDIIPSFVDQARVLPINREGTVPFETYPSFRFLTLWCDNEKG
jgi:hypothetical protein